MKYYAYFPGCSSEATAAALGDSAPAVAKALDIQLMELEDWNCCGSTPYASLEEQDSVALRARDLALAEKTGLDLVTPCSSCFVSLTKANIELKEHPRLMAQVNEALGVAGLSYNGTVRVRLLTEVLVNDVKPEVIAGKVKKPLNGLKVAPYYGCQLARPNFGFEHPEAPTSLDRLVASLGAEPVPFPLKNHCCGGALVISEEDFALELMHKLFKNAATTGADCLVTPCPLCQTNLDVYQGAVNRKYQTNFDIPVLFVTQLMGLALGIDAKELGLKKNMVAAEKVLAKYS